VVQHGAALTRESGRPALAEAVASGRFEEVDERTALCRYALKLTIEPWTMSEEDLAPLRALGLSDHDIVDANQVAS
jgi:alkylhydroperoxidase family enzyme